VKYKRRKRRKRKQRLRRRRTSFPSSSSSSLLLSSDEIHVYKLKLLATWTRYYTLNFIYKFITNRLYRKFVVLVYVIFFWYTIFQEEVKRENIFIFFEKNEKKNKQMLFFFAYFFPRSFQYSLNSSWLTHKNKRQTIRKMSWKGTIWVFFTLNNDNRAKK
jgi:hypothetical protein